MWWYEQLQIFKTSFIELYPTLIEGLKVTMIVTLIAFIGVILLGFISCLMQLSKFKILNALSKIYVYCIRGTPFLVQLFIVFFGIPQFFDAMGFDFRISAFWASVVTCAINGGAYMTEVFRTSIQAVDVGQIEAAKSLGISKFYTMSRIIIPQAIRTSISSIGNQFIITFKDTSVCSVVALKDIVYMGKLYIGRTMQSFVTYMIIGVFYIVIITLASILIHFIERRLNYANKN
ncbi:MAG: amino acid ABC transporter permease [Ruminococcus sp.]|nr:amino acid ABC transporter permease [Ruminococcus sp.]